MGVTALGAGFTDTQCADKCSAHGGGCCMYRPKKPTGYGFDGRCQVYKTGQYVNDNRVSAAYHTASDCVEEKTPVANTETSNTKVQKPQRVVHPHPILNPGALHHTAAEAAPPAKSNIRGPNREMPFWLAIQKKTHASLMANALAHSNAIAIMQPKANEAQGNVVIPTQNIITVQIVTLTKHVL